MSSLLGAFTKPRLAISLALLLTASGVLAYRTMPRQEDPSLPQRFAMVVAPFPGADAEKIERLVLEPIEERLAEVQSIAEVYSLVRSNVALVRIELREEISGDQALNAEWDEIERALVKARRDFPLEVPAPELKRDTNDPMSIVLSVSGSNDPIELRQAAKALKRALLTVPNVARIELAGDPGEQITIEYDDAVARTLGLDARMLSGILARRNTSVPGGAVRVGDRRAILKPAAEFRSLDELANTPLPLPSGNAVALSDVAHVRRGPLEPTAERMRVNGQPAIALGIVPREDIDLVALGAQVRTKVADLGPTLAPLTITEISVQPDQVAARLSELSGSLLLGIGIVAGILFLTMGFRLGLLVSSIVPAVALATLGLYAFGGGLLHQISVAALVIALGMLVDNAIVVAEHIQAQIDAGVDRSLAARNTLKELAAPLAAATGTTLAAFLPMLLAQGNTSDFVRSIPIVIMVALIVSYVFAFTVTPALATRLLRPSATAGSSALSRIAIAERVGRLAVAHRGPVLALSVVLVGGSIFAARFVEQQFFPEADRNQVLVTLELPEGAEIDAIDRASAKLEEAALAHEDVVSVASFIGRGALRFYYNILAKPDSPHRAQVLLTTRSLDAAPVVQAWARDFVRRELPEISAVARRLEQGPPVEAPIEIRLHGEDLPTLHRAANEVIAAVAATPFTRDVRDTAGTGIPAVRLEIDDAVAARHGIAREDVALTLFGRTEGLEVGQLRSEDDPIPILVRSAEGERLPVSDLVAIDVAGVPMGELTSLETEWRPAVIEHRNRSREVSVLAELDEGKTFSAVLRELAPRLDSLRVPPGVRIELGGAGEGSSEANAEIVSAAPLAALVLIVILLAEFNSFRRLAMVLSTVPLAAAGVIPGLLIGRQPFGFMSMLGVIALAGVVVNNAIVLIDRADQLLEEGQTPGEAMIVAVKERTRPVLLTTATTVAGLLPLAFSPTTLWPPLAWAMISGLLASTLLTLLVVPALYSLLIGAPRSTPTPIAAASIAALLAIALIPQTAAAQEEPTDSTSPRFEIEASLTSGETVLSSEDVVRRALARSSSLAKARAAAALAEANAAEVRTGFFPRLETSARYTHLWIQRTVSAIPRVDPAEIDAARALVADVQDPAARMLLAQSVEQQAALSSLSFTLPRNQYAASAALILPISDILLRVRPAHAAAREIVAARRFEAMATEADVALAARRAYFEHARAKGAVAVARESVHQAEVHLERVRARAAAGTSIVADEREAETRVSAAIAFLQRVHGAERATASVLATLLGDEGLPEYAVADDLFAPLSAATTTRDEAVRTALERRSELAAMDRLLEAHRKRANAERGARLPRLAVQGAYEQANPNTRIIPFQARFRSSWEASVVLSWSPNDTAAAGHRVTQRDLEGATVEADRIRLEEAIRIETSSAYEEYRATLAALDSTTSAVGSAEEAYRVRALQHRMGAASSTDVLDADLRVTEARLARLSAQIDAHLARARLARAVEGTDVVAVVSASR